MARNWYDSVVPEDAAPAPCEIDVSVAHPARVYDYWLGGKDNFAADRAAAKRVLKARPGIRDNVRASRWFLTRAIRFLAAEAGVQQFLDIGTGIPAANSTHEVTQAVRPEARVTYVTTTVASRVVHTAVLVFLGVAVGGDWPVRRGDRLDRAHRLRAADEQRRIRRAHGHRRAHRPFARV